MPVLLKFIQKQKKNKKNQGEGTPQTHKMNITPIPKPGKDMTRKEWNVRTVQKTNTEEVMSADGGAPGLNPHGNAS